MNDDRRTSTVDDEELLDEYRYPYPADEDGSTGYPFKKTWPVVPPWPFTKERNTAPCRRSSLYIPKRIRRFPRPNRSLPVVAE